MIDIRICSRVERIRWSSAGTWSRIRYVQYVIDGEQVIRNYHGHLSGVYSMALHPTLDLLVTTGRDATARVWDMRTRSQVMSLNGHEHTVFNVKCQEADPQVITTSADGTVRLWDLTAGKCMSTLTHHKKGVRALAISPNDFTFVSGSPDNIKQVFMKRLTV